MSVHRGFQKSINAMNGLKEVLIKRKENGINDLEEKVNQEADVIDKYSKRVETLSQLDRLQMQRMKKSYRDFSPEFSQFILEYEYIDIYSRNGLEKKFRQIATIVAFAT
ncbi:hypothetical protein [uncultured Apibacter sp.]|uniref:hypothetical protein n=1 Tax=uncultured Apibacter sp. TaxID=1778616 RepID=UPI0025F173C5|nr:hypothetical protein [uncultured Apibacter sp.]